MNEVFLIGEVISNINFDFIINSKYKAIARFKIKTNDNQIINIKVYDKLADFTYRKLKLGNIIFIYGKIRENYVIPCKIKYL